MAILKSTTVTGNLSATGDILASKIIKLGGTANDLLLADGNTITKAQLQADITSNTWRPVKYGTTTLDNSSTTLEFVAGTGISLAFSGGALTISGNAAYSLPAATSSALGGIKIGYNATGANLPVALSSEQAYVALTKDAITTALDYTPIKSLSMRASGNTALKFYYTIDGGTEKAITLKSPKIPSKVSDLTNDSNFATQEWVTDQLGDVDVDLSNYVTLTGSNETISGAKTFTASNTFSNETKFTHATLAPTWKDIAVGIGKSSCFTRGAFMQLITGQILLPNEACTNTNAGVTGGYETTANVLKIQTMTASNSQPVVTTVATIDSSGIATKSFIMTSGTTAKSAWQYNSSTDCVELVWR